MSKVKIQGNASGTGIFTVAAPATNTDRTITLPNVDATILTTAGGTLTNALTINENTFGCNVRLKNDGAGGQDWYLYSTMNSFSQGGGKLMAYNTTVGGLYQWAVDTAGRVTMPYQPSAAVGRSSGQFNSFSTIIWNVAHHNVGNHYNTSTGLFTCPVSGYYLVSIMVMTDATNTTLDIELQVNQATNQSLVPYQSGGATYNQVSGMTVISVSAGDTLSFKLNNGNIYGTGNNGRHSAAVFRLLG